MLNYFPKFFTGKAVSLYFITLLAISLFFMRNSMSFLWITFGVLEAVSFFYFSNLLTKRWAKLKENLFVNRLFFTSLIIRLIWVVFSYFFYQSMTGQPFEFEAADSLDYHGNGEWGAINFGRGNFNIPKIFGWIGVSDYGYSTYLSFLYLIVGNSIIITRLLKAIFGAWTAVLVYRIAQRNFGEGVGRMAGVFAMLMPNLILYCGLHLKEVEMVLLTVLFVERTDNLLRTRNFNFINIFVPLLLATVLFTFRTVLGAAALFGLFTTLLFSSSKILGFGQRFMISIWVIVAIAFFMGGSLATEVEEVMQKAGTNQSDSMEFRSLRKGGNQLAKYASASLFAPTIFVLPVSSMVGIYNQQNQQLIHGGNFVKNVLSFFLYLSAIFIIRQRKWRDFMLIETVFLGYLAVIVLSAFAHSERFYQPALPFYLMFVAYGISNVTNKSKKYFNGYLVFIFVALVAWNFIKLKGRGLI